MCSMCVSVSLSPPSLLQRLLLCRQLGDSSGEGPEFVEEEEEVGYSWEIGGGTRHELLGSDVES